MTRKYTRVFFVLSLCGIFAAVPVFAQTDPVNSDAVSGYGLRNLPNAIIIHANPSTPNAGDTVTFTVEAPVYNLPKDEIIWSVNGKHIADDVGATSVNTTINSKGDPVKVLVSVIDPVWGEGSGEITITPQQIDILFDAPTYVPPFYKGRALPSGGGIMRLQAIARLVKSGKLIPNSQITYTWSRNGTVLGTVSGLGHSAITIDSPMMYGTDVISVHASAEDDTISASASVSIPETPLTPVLYEDHPLFGVTYFNALSREINAGNAMTVAAVPYFATISGISDPTLQYQWYLNNASVAASSTKRNEVTVESGKSNPNLHLDISSTKNFFISASADWKFIFGSSGGSSIVKPGASDAFHNSNL